MTYPTILTRVAHSPNHGFTLDQFKQGSYFTRNIPKSFVKQPVPPQSWHKTAQAEEPLHTAVLNFIHIVFIAEKRVRSPSRTPTLANHVHVMLTVDYFVM